MPPQVFFDPLQLAYNTSCAALDAFFARLKIGHALQVPPVHHH